MRSEVYCTRYKNSKWKTPYVTISEATLDIAFKNLSYGELALYLFIAKNERNAARESLVSYRYIEKGMGCSPSTVAKGLEKLTKLGFIDREGKNYITRYYESAESMATATEIEVPDRYRNRSESATEIVAAPLQKSTQREEGTTYLKEKGGEEAAAPKTPPPSVPPAVVPKQAQVFSILHGPDADRRDDELEATRIEAELSRAMNLAEFIGNPILSKKYFSSDLPISFIPREGRLFGFEQLQARHVFTTLTNAMVKIQKDHKMVLPIMPNSYKEAEQLGDVVSSFLQVEDWERRFTSFYKWVMDNKTNYSVNLLGFYQGDWQEELMAEGNVLRRSS